MNVQVFQSADAPVSEQPFEYVERKGLGHPDSICDSMMEAAAQALRAEYVARCGRVLHHNLDKALLVAGQSSPQLGGGTILGPASFVAGDRAASQFQGEKIPVDEIVETAVRKWISDHLRFVEPAHLAFESRIQPGSVELTDIFNRDVPVANDTSAGFGFAPLSDTERIVLSTEKYMNSPAFKEAFPFAGEDVKVMAVRNQRRLHLTIAVAMVDRFVPSVSAYFQQKETIRHAVVEHAREQVSKIEDFVVDVNALDDPTREEAGIYLTVTGTSAESGDGGEVGRGNAVNGLISLLRPTSNEAAAGKNTTCHVGNIYNYRARAIAKQVHETIATVRECYVWLCSQIGRPVDDPLSTSVRLVLESSVDPGDLADEVNSIVHSHLQGVGPVDLA